MKIGFRLWTNLRFDFEMHIIIAASSCCLANWYDCLDSLCFCLFCYRVFYVRSYILLFLWRNRINFLTLFSNFIFKIILLLSFRLKWGEYFTFVFSNLINCTWVIIVIEYQIIRVLSWFCVFFNLLKI